VPDGERWHLDPRCCRPILAPQQRHIPDIGGARRIGKHCCLQILGRQTVSYHEAEEIDDIFGMRPDEMGAQDLVGVLLDERLETVDRFVEPRGRIPVRILALSL
jgi:hypothetical protein